MKHIAILGSSGSIGENTLRVAASLPAALSVAAVAVGRDYRRALEQAASTGARHVAVADEAAAAACAREAPPGVVVHAGRDGVAEVAGLPEVDVVLCAIVGMAGLRPVLSAIRAGKDVALATKEVLVAAGALVTAAAARAGVRLLPVDSEHSAIFQCLGATAFEPSTLARIRRLVLTASGGPFAGRPEVDFDRVTVAEAIAHPRWDMGPKISVDSATMMNKGLEVIEGHWLFGTPLDRIDVVLHPQSIVHSLVEFQDGSLLAQMSSPDMRYAIQYALTFPERMDSGLPAFDLGAVGRLDFAPPDDTRFPCLRLAREAGRTGGSMPAVMNAANEAAVESFLAKRIPFSGIWRFVASAMERHDVVSAPSLDEIVAADAWARDLAGHMRV